MKKAVAVLVLVALALVTLSGCSSGPVVTKMGLGHVSSISKSTDRAAGQDGAVTPPMAQVDTTIAVVAFDKDGKVVKATIDTAQTKVNFDKDLKVTGDLKVPGKTRVELGDAYGMAKASGIKKEWYQQIAELEKWMVGKTVDQIKGMKLTTGTKAGAPDVPELKTLVTVTVTDYIAAVDEAYKNAVEVKGVATLGLGHVIRTDRSVGYASVDGKETLPSAHVNDTIAATAFDKDGKIVKVIIDAAETTVAFDKDGKVTSDKTVAPKTARELGDSFGMAKASGIKKEWYQQIAELEKWMIGKTADQVKGLKVTTAGAHPGAADIPELKTLVTVSVTDYISAVAEAKTNAKSVVPAK